MSFRIYSYAAAACPTLGVQERHAHDQRHHPHGSSKTAHLGALDESAGDRRGPSKSSLAIRRAQDCQAVLGDALGFLRSQDDALARLQEATSHTLLESLSAERFNSLALFSRTDGDDPIWIENLDTPDAVEISRPPVRHHLHRSPPQLAEFLAEARENNHRTQMRLEHLLESLRSQLLDHELAPHQLRTRDEALPCALASRNALLGEAREALAVQANSCHESLLRLFE